MPTVLHDLFGCLFGRERFGRKDATQPHSDNTKQTNKQTNERTNEQEGETTNEQATTTNEQATTTWTTTATTTTVATRTAHTHPHKDRQRRTGKPTAALCRVVPGQERASVSEGHMEKMTHCDDQMARSLSGCPDRKCATTGRI